MRWPGSMISSSAAATRGSSLKIFVRTYLKIAGCCRSDDPLDAELRKDGIEMIAPHRGNRSKPPTQDRRRLSRYMRRWLVERFFAWIQWQRRILIRWEYHAHNFLGFVQLACLVILFKRF